MGGRLVVAKNCGEEGVGVTANEMKMGSLGGSVIVMELDSGHGECSRNP